MFNKNTERRSYRRSPGRQYSEEYQPLRAQRDPQTWQDEEVERGASHPGVLSPRPDPRRTRQLMRQNILAGKARSTVLDPLQEDADYPEEHVDGHVGRMQHSRRPSHPVRTYPARRYQEIEEEQIVEDWVQHGESMPDYMDPDLGYDDEEDDDPLAARVRQANPRATPDAGVSDARSGAARYGGGMRDAELEDELLEEELEEKRKKAARRKFLLGAVAVGGTAVAAYEIIPRIPGAIGSGAANIEHQLQQAFQQGVASGADAARKDLLNGLDTIEGFSLDGAIAAAKLTRVAYDVFVSPLVTLAANVAGDFLSVTLAALITGRKWLAQINEDSPTLAALQTVLQSWVDQVKEMPKEVQNITDSDLDGAQSYLRALQRKIQQEQAQLNNPSTPTPASNNTPQSVITPPAKR